MNVVIFFNQDKSYLISMHDLKKDILFTTKLFEVSESFSYEVLYKVARKYADNLADFLECDVVEEKY
jgi:hypothetical protein